MSRVHGVFSIMLIGIAVAIAAGVLFAIAPGWVAAYLALCALGGSGVVYAFCAKCPCKVRCGHVLPGLTARLFPRQPGPYARWEVGVVVISVVVLLGLPLLWLWHSPVALIAFVALSGVATWDILTFVCKACNNVYCPLQMRK